MAVPTSASPRRPCGYPGGQSGCSLTPGWQGVNGLVHDTSLKPLASHQAVLTNPDLLGQIRISRLACVNDAMYCRGQLGAPCLSLYHEKEKKNIYFWLNCFTGSMTEWVNEENYEWRSIINQIKHPSTIDKFYDPDNNLHTNYTPVPKHLVHHLFISCPDFIYGTVSTDSTNALVSSSRPHRKLAAVNMREIRTKYNQ